MRAMDDAATTGLDTHSRPDLQRRSEAPTRAASDHPHRPARRPFPATLASSVAILAIGSAVWAQAPTVSQVDVLFSDDPSPTGYSFGEQVDAAGRWAVASGVATNGAQRLRGWELQEDGVWQVGYSESFGAASATAASPVAVSAGTVYRAADDPSSGFVVRKKFVDTTFAQPWETVWDAQNGTAEATSMDVWGLSLGDFAMGTLLAVGYRTTATDPPFPLGRFAIVVDESGGGPQLVYSGQLLFGGSPSVSADNYQVAVGLPGGSQVVVVTSGPNEPWVQEQVISGPTGIGFGTAVALRGSLLAVGAPQASVCVVPPSTGCVTSGQVYLYSRQGGSWQLDQVLVSAFDGVPENALLGSALTFSVVTSSDPVPRLAVGAPAWAVPSRGGTNPDGAVLLAEHNGSSMWSLQARAITAPPDTNELGTSVAFSGTEHLVAGAPRHDEGPREVGAVLAYRVPVFLDGFELGNLSRWSAAVP
jgi:hypothetical protein